MRIPKPAKPACWAANHLAGFARVLPFLLLVNIACLQKSCSDQRSGPQVIAGNRDNRILSPFPTDRLTVPDAATPTGLRVDLPIPENIPQLEKQLLQNANQLDGFGLFAPICVRFDQPLDLSSVTPDSCYLVNVEDGTRVPLDFGLGYYPAKLSKQVALFPGDPVHPSLIFPQENRVDHYEDETNCLILRPVIPLKPASRYAVLLTRSLRGLGGDPIEPPPNEPPTEEEFQNATRAMQSMGLAPVDVGFFWTFTTQTLSADLEAIRAGLDGQGSLGWLRKSFLPRISSIRDLEHGLTDGNRYTLEASVAAGAFNLIYQISKILAPKFPELEKDIRPHIGFYSDPENVDYFFFGTYQSPSFRGASDGVFDINRQSGEAAVSSSSVPFLISIPKPTAANNFAKPPYPVVVLGHGLTGSRLMAMSVANRMAAYGWAVACIDFIGHGPQIQFYQLMTKVKSLEGTWRWLVKPALSALGLLAGCLANPFDPYSELVEKVFSCGLLGVLFTDGRSTDMNGDGLLDPGAAFFSPNFFQMRDILRQCVVDEMQFVRVLRALGTDWNQNGKLDRAEGDVDGDGVLDLGGPIVPIRYAGISLGAILGSVLVAVDPAIQTAVLNVGGGGLADVMFRTKMLDEYFLRHVIDQVFGVTVVGQPVGNQLLVTFNNDPPEKAFWSVPFPLPKSFEIFNTTKNLWETADAAHGDSFAVSIASDVGDSLEVSAQSFAGKPTEKSLASPFQGLGVPRHRPRTRETLMLLEWIVEPGDPVCYAPCWWQCPLDGVPEKRVLMQLSCGDPVVPISAGVALARAAGLISPERMGELVSLGVPQGANVPVDLLLPPESAHFRALRFHTAGKHAYVLGDNKTAPEDATQYALAAQDQMAAFIASDGLVVKEHPIFGLVLEDDN